MLSLIVGGAASGKSAYAERLVLGLDGPRVYVATMEPWDEECVARIERHRARRAGYGFQTIECPRNLAGIEVCAHTNVLLDCLGNLLANEMWQPEGDTSLSIENSQEGSTPLWLLDVLAGVRHLNSQCDNLTIVTNEVCLAGTAYKGDTLPYLRAIAFLNRTIAAEADFVCEVVAGLPNVLKGEPPCAC